MRRWIPPRSFIPSHCHCRELRWSDSTLTNNLGPVAKNYFVTKTVSACVSARTASEPLTGSPIMATLDIPESWTPTAENLWALPKPLRRYIHHLQSNVDHVETMRENFRLRQENAALRKKLAGHAQRTSTILRRSFLFWTERLVPRGSSVQLFANSEMSPAAYCALKEAK